MKKMYLYSIICPLLFSLMLSSACRGQQSPSDLGIPSFEAKDKTDKIHELIGTYAEYGEFNGAVLVAEKGKVLYQKGLGIDIDNLK